MTVDSQTAAITCINQIAAYTNNKSKCNTYTYNRLVRIILKMCISETERNKGKPLTLLIFIYNAYETNTIQI